LQWPAVKAECEFGLIVISTDQETWARQWIEKGADEVVSGKFGVQKLVTA
jgi:hypothetical protein